MVRTRLAHAAGGWPEVIISEDLAYALVVSELAAGVSTAHVITRYRAWRRQTALAPWYPEVRQETFALIEKIVNELRGARGRDSVNASQTRHAVAAP